MPYGFRPERPPQPTQPQNWVDSSSFSTTVAYPDYPYQESARPTCQWCHSAFQHRFRTRRMTSMPDGKSYFSSTQKKTLNLPRGTMEDIYPPYLIFRPHARAYPKERLGRQLKQPERYR